MDFSFILIHLTYVLSRKIQLDDVIARAQEISKLLTPIFITIFKPNNMLKLQNSSTRTNFR